MKFYRKIRRLFLKQILLCFVHNKKVIGFVFKNNSGFSLMEILVVVGISSVILFGTFKILNVSVQSSQIVKTSFSEQDLRVAMGRVLGSSGQCKINLKPVANGISNLGKGPLDQLRHTQGGSNVVLLQRGESFKNDLEIVDMQLVGGTDDPKTMVVERNFVVYYKKNIVGVQNTLGGGVCDTTDTTGCYFSQCRLKYELDAADDVTTCDVLDCTGGEESVPCYVVDELDETGGPNVITSKEKGRTLVGCGGTAQIAQSTNTAFGFGAGASSMDGGANTFIGYKAGASNTSGYSVFVGHEAGFKRTGSGFSTFIGYRAGYESTHGANNVMIGSQAGYGNIASDSNIFIGHQAGYSYDDALLRSLTIGNSSPEGQRNIFIGYRSGYGNKTGQSNIFLGYESGKSSTGGHGNIFIGKRAGEFNRLGRRNLFIGDYVGPLENTTIAGIDRDGRNQLNIGNLILGRMQIEDSHVDTEQTLQNSPNIPPDNNPPTPGVVINGDLVVRGEIKCGSGSNILPQNCGFDTNGITLSHDHSGLYALDGHDHNLQYALLSHVHNLSSKVYKKNIKPFKDYDKALKDIVDTPLFTYEYKKDHPKKSRMGIISEELPEHLQIKGLDSRLRGNDQLRGKGRHPHKTRHPRANGDPESKGDAPSMPDWPSIYGTFWASIKALFIKFKSFKDQMLSELKTLKEQFTIIFKDVEASKEVIGSLDEQIQDTVELSKENQKENDERDKELIKLKNLLKETTEELETHKKALKKIEEMVQKNKRQCPPTNKKSLKPLLFDPQKVSVQL